MKTEVTNNSQGPILSVEGLTVCFTGDTGKRTVTDGITFAVRQGETLGIVGESGCGKSVTSLAVMGLLPKNGRAEQGKILFRGADLLMMSEKELDEIRGADLTMVFQDALAALNPVFTVGNQLVEVIRKHREKDRKKARAIAERILAEVGLPDPAQVLKKYPGELSGGQRQRVMIGMALACGPKLLIADEPTTALDVTIQAQIMDLIGRVAAEEDMSMILITHDIGLVAQTADRVLVMYAGQIIEEAPVRELFHHPLHPYTQGLLASAPGLLDAQERRLASIPGMVPEDYSDMTGCRFFDRCPKKCRQCHGAQERREVTPGHFVRCLRAEEADHE